jgi:CDP-diacylglycerol--serine O-phosphatidyltransferase
VRPIAIVPTLLTLGNAVCGFIAIAFASQIPLKVDEPATSVYIGLSAVFILLAMVFDGLDGYAARLTHCTSEFGAQLDSLCDAISFGAAPAFLLWRMCQDVGRPFIPQAVAVIAALYVSCTVLRLARFNLEHAEEGAAKRFTGLPSPAAAGCVASLALLRCDLPLLWTVVDKGLMRGIVGISAPLAALVVAVLMVSAFPYPHYGRQMLRSRKQFAVLVRVVLTLSLIALTLEVSFFLLFWAYALNAPLRYALLRLRRRNKPLPDPTPGLD